MAVGPFLAYEKGLLRINTANINFASDTVKVAILVTAHTADIVNHEFFSDVSTHECGDGDYAQQTLGSKTVTIVSGKIRFSSANINFGSSVTISGRYLVIYKDTGTPTTSPLIWIQDLNTGGGNVSSTNSNFAITISASGIYEITANV